MACFDRAEVVHGLGDDLAGELDLQVGGYRLDPGRPREIPDALLAGSEWTIDEVVSRTGALFEMVDTAPTLVSVRRSPTSFPGAVDPTETGGRKRHGPWTGHTARPCRPVYASFHLVS